jgi:cAMP-dependent protein kinase regulator
MVKTSDRAGQLLARGELAPAAAEFEAAVQRAPGDVTLRQRLVEVYLRLGRKLNAVRELQQVAGRYAKDGQLLRAIAIGKVILELDPRHTETQGALASLYAQHPELHPRLPSSMAGASEQQDGPAAPLDLDSLAVFRQALAGTLALPLGDDPRDEATGIEVPRAVDVGALPASPLFSALDRAAFAAVVERLDLRWMTAGETLVKEGEPGDSMFVVVQGTVNVLRQERGAERLIALLTEGAFFGEMALLTDAPRLATVIAATDGLLFEIDRDALEQIAARHPSVEQVVEEFYQQRMLENLLRVSPLFRPFSLAQKQEIGARFLRHSLPPGTILLEQGQPGEGLCVLLRGQCKVFHRGAGGEPLPLPPLREGDVFGEISLLLDGPCTATVQTQGYCEVLELPAEDFKRLVLPNDEVRAMIRRIVSERLSRTADLLDGRVLPDFIV